MRLRDRLATLRPPYRLPSRTIRLRLTILYATLFLVCGAGLLAITYLLMLQASGTSVVSETSSRGVVTSKFEPTDGQAAKLPLIQEFRNGPGQPLTPRQVQAQAQRDEAVAQQQSDAELRELLEQSGIALALMTAASIGLGWFAAGRVLRPLRTINERARAISASSLHKRLALAGPDDELTQLARTIDELLGRLDASFTAQRQFVANASHELRTPLARAQTLAEVALGDPEATVDSLRASHRRVLAAGEQQERLIEALLTLARSERGLDEHEAFDLATIAATVLHARRHEAELHGHVSVHATLETAETSGDPRLVERLVANLIDNALRHNRPDGRVDVTTATSGGHAVLTVANTGPPVPSAELERLFQPFQRLGADRTDSGDGTGLGLSIVAAIAAAHGAVLTTVAQPGGGLEIEVSFRPARTPADGPAAPEAAGAATGVGSA